jgi:GR25 family glycosyltransferase involved in LPS biosynthesis
MIYKIYILTIERNIYRTECIKKKLNEKNIEYEVFYGIDYKKYDKSKLKKMASSGYGKLCPYSTLSCAISHIMLWEHISKSNIDFAIILEDDTYLTDNFFNYLDYIYNNINNTVIYLYYDNHYSYKNYDFVLSNGAYCIAPSTAKKIVDYYMIHKIAFHIDFQNNFTLYRLKINKLVIKEMAAEQINGNISSMGIIHNHFFLSLFVDTYMHRILTTPILRINEKEFDIYYIIFILSFFGIICLSIFIKDVNEFTYTFLVFFLLMFILI